MKKFISNKILLRIIGIVIFILGWQILSMIIGSSNFILPSPIETISETIKMLGSSYIYKCLYQTLLRMISGFVIAFVIAFVLGNVAANIESFEEIIKPTMLILKSVPTATLVYLFLVVAGAKLTPLFIVVLVSLPILYESVVGGIKSTPKQLIEASEIDASSTFNTAIKIRIPLAVPYIMVGIASSFGLSLKIEIMAEVITGYTRMGLGSAILAAQRSDPTNMVPIFAYSLVAIVVMLIVDSVSDLIKQRYK